MASVPNYIRHWREAHGLTQLQLAEEIGVDKSTISKWESGEREVSDDHKRLLARHFTVPVSAIFEFEWSPYTDALRRMGSVVTDLRSELASLRAEVHRYHKQEVAA